MKDMENKRMEDKRTKKVKQHYFIYLNNERFKILKHTIDDNKSLFTIRTKIFGQNLPHGDNVLVSMSEDGDQTFIVAWKSMYKDEKIEYWEYKIIT